MDLVSTIRKEGSRGGVNFSWDDVQGSSHRENYLGHSVMAPVGRWQKGRDLNWYAKGDDKEARDGETAEERKVRERKEEIRKVKEAEEDAMNKALGLPPVDRGGTGVNGMALGKDRMGMVEGVRDEDKVEGVKLVELMEKVAEGKGRGREKRVKREDRSRSRERRHRSHRHRHRSRSGDRNERRRHRSTRDDYRDRDARRERSRSVDRRERLKQEDRPYNQYREETRYAQARRSRSRSPARRERRE